MARDAKKSADFRMTEKIVAQKALPRNRILQCLPKKIHNLVIKERKKGLYEKHEQQGAKDSYGGKEQVVNGSRSQWNRGFILGIQRKTFIPWFQYHFKGACISLKYLH